MKPLSKLLAGGVGALLIGTLATAKVESLTLEQMVQKTDDAVFGTIVDQEVIRIDHPVDGPELYYTTLYVEGRSLVDGQPRSAAVTFAGGWIDANNGAWNSEAPSVDETALGNQVVVFHKWTDNMGGDVAAHSIYAAHGGLYPTFESLNGTIVQGRGEGYAVSSNIRLSQLDERITAIAERQEK